MKTHLVLIASLLLSSLCFGQKVKVKKNIVCKDNLPVLRFENVNIQRPKFTAEKAVLSIDNDTVAWLSKNLAYLSKAKYESEERMISYYEFELNGMDTVLTYAYEKQDDFYKDLAESNILDRDSLNDLSWDIFRFKSTYKLAAVDLLSQALKVREELMAKEGYLKYVEKNTVRNPNAELSISNDLITFKATKETVPSGIGALERTISNGRTYYKVYNNRGQKLIATIEFDIVPRHVTISTEFDHARIDLPIPKGEIDEMLYTAIRFLLDGGYI